MRIDQLEPAPTSADQLEIPAELLDSVLRHQSHLASLIVSLRDAGMREDLVDASIRTLMDGYASELATAIHAMMKGQCDNG